MAYKLTVSGKVDFNTEGDEDSIKELFQGPHSTAQVERAIQDLQEEASDVKVELVEIEG